ncbi:hypothetical protein O5O45_08765 [Hahella aquimaris]|uniref:hypothetical protein n=1 Tax=Hahella sp. HNIBRBA332 TaxID=3015983 RepID=UPI00273A897A|nr:hypothetical protein [Hahella sp. HNIBRBA332]WLQ16004.1 hypothetical protein O5O45_08765 [Hahella sp. HNIBRBA332]
MIYDAVLVVKEKFHLEDLREFLLGHGFYEGRDVYHDAVFYFEYGDDTVGVIYDASMGYDKYVNRADYSDFSVWEECLGK